MKSVALRIEHGNHDDGLLVMKMCKRKKAYPLRPQAMRDLLAMSRETGEEFNIYNCGFCGKLHIGHKSKPVFEFTRNELFTDTLYIGEECLVNLRCDSEFYIFKVPLTLANASTSEIVEEGELVAFKEGQAPYYEKGGIQSKKWQIFTAMAYRQLHQYYGCQDVLESKRQSMGTLNCILLIQPDAVIEPQTNELEPVAVQAPAVEPEQNPMPEVTTLPNGDVPEVQETLLEKLRRLSSPDSGMTGEFFRGYVFALLEQEHAVGNEMLAVAA